MLQDIRSALRSMRRSPGFAIVVILTLALGIGANTAIFTVVNTVLLRSLPLPEADQLVTIREARLPDLPSFSVSPANFRSFREQNHVLTGLAAMNPGNYTLTGQGEPISVEGVEVSADFFSVVQVAPSLGRGYTAEETVAGGEPLVVISHDLWLGRFGGDSRVLERSMMIDGTLHRIIGVMPAGFDFPRRGKLWLPLQLPADPDAQRGAHYLSRGRPAAAGCVAGRGPAGHLDDRPAAGRQVPAEQHRMVGVGGLAAGIDGRPLAAGAADAAGGRRPGGAHRLRQRRQPAARAGGRPGG